MTPIVGGVKKSESLKPRTVRPTPPTFNSYKLRFYFFFFQFKLGS